MQVKEGSRYVNAEAAASVEEPFVWTVRGVTEHGVYITCPESRSPGHLISESELKRYYLQVQPPPVNCSASNL